MDDRNRAAPVTLPRYPPVAQPIIHAPLADSCLFHARRDLFLGFPNGHAVEEIGIDHHRIGPLLFEVGLGADFEFSRIHAVRGDYGYDWKTVFAGKFEIALIVGWAAEDRSLAIGHEHEIGGEDRQSDTVPKGVTGIEWKPKPLFLRRLDCLLARAERCHLAAEFSQARLLRLKLAGEGVIGRNCAEGGTEDGVVPGRVDGEPLLKVPSLFALQREGEPHTLRLADPVTLHEA